MLKTLIKWLTPPARKIFLHETTLRGANYYDTRDLIARGELHIGQRVQLRREAQNPHDEYAVAVFSERGQKLAYLPRAQNHIVACLLDHDESVIASISKIQPARHEPVSVKLWLVVSNQPISKTF